MKIEKSKPRRGGVELVSESGSTYQCSWGINGFREKRVL